MCGICGIYGQGDKHDVIEMRKQLEHRGHDQKGLYIDDNVGLGHGRLSIIDLSSRGEQPMSNEDHTVFLVVNGEVYNHKELRERLEALGHTFYSNSDSEVIVHAYEEFGIQFLHRLRGMFALALYDKRSNKIVLARDPIGKKPLYYSYDGRRLVFASEIKALFYGGVEKKVDYDSIPGYLMYQYSMGDATLFAGVNKLCPGHVLIVSPDKSSLIKYWEIKEGKVIVADDAAAQLRELLNESVRLRLVADVPVGAFLSGGIDSSSVVGLWRAQSNQVIHTFTAIFDTNSEAAYAKKVSQHLHTNYHEVMITADMVVKDVEKIAWHHDEPLGDAAVINNYYLAQEAKKHVTVVLAGEGGDELFGGYPWHQFVPYINIMKRIPRRDILASVVGRIGGGNMTSIFDRVQRIALFPAQDNINEMYIYPETAMSKQNVEWLIGKNVISGDYRKPTWRMSSYNRMLALDCLNLLPEKFLMKADKATMAWAVEERLPLLDKKVIDFAFSLSPQQKHKKYILRKAVEDLLPQEIVWRKKAGFGTPISHWLNSKQLSGMVLDRLSNGELLHDVCKPEALTQVIDHRGDTRLANAVWTLFALQVWYDVYFGGKR